MGKPPAVLKITGLDRLLLSVAPKFALGRIRARALAFRHFDAASVGRRTSGWRRSSGDANAENGSSLGKLREHSRDLMRNNAWARNGQRVIARNTIGWGILPKPVTKSLELGATIGDLFKLWAGTTQCDAEGRATFFGLQRQIVETLAESGEVLIRRRSRRRADGLAIPLQIQVLEPDYLDTGKDGVEGAAGGQIVQGVEYNKLGKRVAYWLFEDHPGSSRPASLSSRRVNAEQILHLLKLERPGQVRGVPWFAPVILVLKDLDEYEDATLVRQKIAALFTAFVTDTDGDPAAAGEEDAEEPDELELMEPGTINYLKPGRSIEFATPPVVSDYDVFTRVHLRRISAGIGVPYEELSQDYSQSNFSSSRMSRLAHYANVHDWRWNLVIPQFCDPIWAWAMNAAFIDGTIPEPVLADWTPPPMAMLEPDKEGLAYQRLLRIGAMTHDDMVREQGFDPDQHWRRYAEGLQRFDLLKIVLDSDPRKTSAAGQIQPDPAAPKASFGSKPVAKAGEEAGAGGDPVAKDEN